MNIINPKNQKRLIIAGAVITVVLTILLLLVLANGDSDMRDSIAVVLQFAEIITVLFTLLFTIEQIIGSKEITRATFIMELNQNYVENSEYMEIYDVLQKQFEAMKSDKPIDDKTLEELEEIEISSISNYLTFFETLFILKNRGVISFDIIDDLFGYRFFLAVHSDLFQTKKLRYQPDNFKNIFKLEKEWLEYRVAIGKNQQKDLDDAFEMFAKMDTEQRKTAKWKNVYEARQLRGLVDMDTYERLVR